MGLPTESDNLEHYKVRILIIAFIFLKLKITLAGRKGVVGKRNHLLIVSAL